MATRWFVSYLATQPALRHAIASDGVVKVGVVSKIISVCTGDSGARDSIYHRKLQVKGVRAAISAVVPEHDERQN